MTDKQTKRYYDPPKKDYQWSDTKKHLEHYMNSELMIQDQNKFNAMNMEKAELDLFKRNIKKFLSEIQNTFNEKGNRRDI